MSRALVLVALTLCLTGCPAALRWSDTPPASGVYEVRQGDSLYAIALRYDLSADDLARWNGLGDSDLIFPGQKLKLRGPAAPAASARPIARPPSTPSASRPATPASTVSNPQSSAAIDWLWPAEGSLAARFGASGGAGKGIEISGKEGDSVFAAAGGKVVYSGDGLIGYGNLIIVKHSRSVLSAYGYNRELLVGEGDIVAAGQRIAKMGTGPGRRPLLHFEIRVDGQPADPLSFLPAQ